jgi:hypothetical protein
MVKSESIERYRMASGELSRRVASELAAYFAALDLSKPEATRDALLEFVPLLVAQYGQVAEVLAMDWYDELRMESEDAGTYVAAIPPSVPVVADQVAETVRYLAGKLWTPNPASMLAGLSSSTDKFVKQYGRDTIAWNADREGVRFARVPSGDKTCAWCLMLASRDAVYVSKASAGDIGTGYGDGFHGFCDCVVTRIAKAADYPEAYLPDNYYAMYMDAREVAGSGDAKDISAALRRLHPDALTDGVHTH